jgi:NIPSNAP
MATPKCGFTPTSPARPRARAPRPRIRPSGDAIGSDSGFQAFDCDGPQSRARACTGGPKRGYSRLGKRPGARRDRQAWSSSKTQEEIMIHELRVYNCVSGRLPDLVRRFETITLDLWKRHGIRPVAFWTVLVGESNQQLIYLLAWESLAEREKVWSGFMSDPEWISKRTETERNGPIVASISNSILQPTAFSGLK